MRLANNLSTVFPDTPNPPDQKVLEISNALDAAMITHIQNVYVPVGFGQAFLGALVTQTPFLQSLAAYLDTTISPILSTALSLENNPSSPLPHLVAWANVQPSFDALIPAVPPFMAGPQGALFWQVILLTIRFFITPLEIPEEEEDSSSDDSLVTLEDEIES